MVAIPKSKVDREDEARTKRINDLAGPLLHRLGILQMYSLTTVYEDKVTPNLEELVGGRGVAATCTDCYPYREITLHIDRAHFDHLTDDYVVNLITHEVLHPLIFGDMGRVAADQGFLRSKRNKLVWASLEENAVDLLALWIAGFWNEMRAAEAKKRKRTARPAATS